MNALRLYQALPLQLQNLSLSAYSLVLQRRYYGNGFEQNCDALDRQERWSRERIGQWQLAEARRVVEVASYHVPYYRNVFTSSGVSSSDLNSLSDIQRFPLLEKETIRQNARQLLDERLDERHLAQDRTSGSTGTPLVIYWSDAMFPRWWALQERRVRAWAGVSQVMPRAMVGGRSIIAGTSRGPYWRYNFTWRQLYMSSYHISPRTAPSYVDALIRHGSQWITGYGSAVAQLGEWLVEHPERQVDMRAAVTSGDNLLTSHREAIQAGFRCHVFDNYGSAEGCLVISECEHGRMHVQPESGILEILDEDRRPCRPGEVGEMVITGLMNEAMPLIRYRIGDLAAWSPEQHCPCGRSSALVSHIEGRADEYLLLPDGRRIGRLSTAMKKSLTVRSAQLVQDAPDHAWLLVVPGVGYREVDGDIVRADILSRIGSFQIDVSAIEVLPKTRAGKQRLVVRLFDHPDLAALYQQQLREIPWRC